MSRQFYKNYQKGFFHAPKISWKCPFFWILLLKHPFLKDFALSVQNSLRQSCHGIYFCYHYYVITTLYIIQYKYVEITHIMSSSRCLMCKYVHICKTKVLNTHNLLIHRFSVLISLYTYFHLKNAKYPKGR